MRPISMQDKNRQRFTQKCVVGSISGRLKRRNDMETHKIYYAVIILVCAASMLLSPFFYIRRTRSGTELRRAPRQSETHPLRQHHHDCGFACLVEMV